MGCQASSDRKAILDNALWFGLFLLDDDGVESSLEHDIKNKHITFGYKTGVPEGINWEKKYDVELIGYANDGANEGYEVVIPEEVERLYHGAGIPHMTTSLAQSARAVDTKELDFEKIVPMTKRFRFGYSTGKDAIFIRNSDTSDRAN